MKKVRSMNISPRMSANDLILEYGKAGVLNAGNVAMAVDIYERMVREDATIFFGLSGALVPGGFRNIIRDLIEDELMDVLVTTGANIVHDLIETFGGGHYIGSSRVDDVELRKKEINRIYNVFLPEKHYATFRNEIKEIFQDISSENKILSIRELLYEIGKRVEDKESILRTAYEKDVPVFCPAISDSELGLAFYEGNPSLVVDTFKDLKDFIDIAKRAKKSGAVILGGGVPKNFIFQAMVPKAMKKERGGHEYVIQITLDRPETGGLSGATLEEAVSWTKVKESKQNKVRVISEVSMVFPIMVAALRERLKR